MLLTILLVSAIFLAGLITLVLRTRWSEFYMPWWVILLFVAFIFIGLFFIISQSSEISNGLIRQSWPKVKAKIIETKIIGERAYSPELLCEYFVEGKKYLLKTDLKTPGFGRKKSRQQTSRIIIAEHPVGSFVPVHYNPENPEESFMRTGPYFNNYMIVSLGYFLLCSGLIIISGSLIRKLRN